MTTPTVNLSAGKRVPFDVTIPVMGVDYSGATLAMEVRTAKGGTGTALASLAGATPPSQGLSVTYDANFVDPDGVMPNGASLVRIIMSEATMEGLPANADTSKDAVFFYDIHLTPVGGTKFPLCGGTITVDPGVTV